jgi:hypothetical protein
MLRSLFEHVGEATSRRGFLNSAASAAGAIALALLGVRPAYANGTTFPVACCHLAKNPATCSYSGCSCEWSWPCAVNNGDHTFDHYACKECYSSSVCPGAATNDDKTGAKCSKAAFLFTSGGGGCGGGGCKPGICC